MTALWAWVDAALLFASVLAAGFVLGSLWRRGLQGSLIALERVLSHLDQILVRRCTWVFGTRWVKGRLAGVKRWGHLIAAFSVLSLAGATFPFPIAVVCLGLAYLGVLAIVRQWSWDEDDRANDVPDDLRRVRGGGDLVNEAIFAGACLFLLTPILFFRLDIAFGLFEKPPALGLFAYDAYTFGEFLEAVPLLDYSEVYGIQNISGVTASSFVGRHATFAFRVVLDFVLIGGLIQLISVMQRVAAGRDIRRLQAALNSDDDDDVMEAVGQLKLLGLRNQTNAQRALVFVLDARGADFDFRYKPELRCEAANAIQNIGARFADTPLLLTAIDAYQALLRSAPLGSPGWAAIQTNLGNAQRVLGGRIGGADGLARLTEAIAAYRNALEVTDRHSAPLVWAANQNNIGNALQTMGGRLGGTEGVARLTEATAAFRSALDVYSRGATPTDWVMTQNNLGATLRAIGWSVGGPDGIEKLVQSLAVLRTALEVCTRETEPDLWATLQHNLGGALLTRGLLMGGRESIALSNEAAEAFRAALTVRTRAATPVDWADSMNNLGAALWTFGSAESDSRGTAFLVEAIGCFRSALDVRTRDAMPTDWAMTQSNLGAALAGLGERRVGTKGTQHIFDAGEAFRAALSVRTRTATPIAHAETQNNLGLALSALGQRVGGAQGREHLRAAIHALRAALDAYRDIGAAQETQLVVQRLLRVESALQARRGETADIGNEV